jgi:hypothetical protein
MLRRTCAGIVAVFIGASAFASWINVGLSAEEAHQIKRFAVVSSLRDEIHGRLIGLTIFQSKAFDASVPGWNLDDTVTKTLIEQIVAGGKMGGEVIALAIPSSKKSEILSEARKQGIDAVLVVIPEQSVPDRAIVGGVMLVRQKRLGVDRVYPCAGMVVRVWRVSDGKQIGFTAPDPCDFEQSSPHWHDKWEDFSDEEKQATLTSLGDFVGQRLKTALIRLKLREK